MFIIIGFDEQGAKDLKEGKGYISMNYNHMFSPIWDGCVCYGVGYFTANGHIVIVEVYEEKDNAVQATHFLNGGDPPFITQLNF
jgi:hypothetical protein